jgi:hypothetical protein
MGMQFNSNHISYFVKSCFMTLVEHVGGQLIEEDKFGKDEAFCKV